MRLVAMVFTVIILLIKSHVDFLFLFKYISYFVDCRKNYPQHLCLRWSLPGQSGTKHLGQLHAESVNEDPV